MAKSIDCVPKGLAKRKYCQEFADKYNPGVIQNLRQSGFRLAD